MGPRVDHLPLWPLRLGREGRRGPGSALGIWYHRLLHTDPACFRSPTASPGLPPEALTGSTLSSLWGGHNGLGLGWFVILTYMVNLTHRYGHRIMQSSANYTDTIHFHSVNPSRSKTTFAAVTTPPTVRARASLRGPWSALVLCIAARSILWAMVSLFSIRGPCAPSPSASCKGTEPRLTVSPSPYGRTHSRPHTSILYVGCKRHTA